MNQRKSSLIDRLLSNPLSLLLIGIVASGVNLYVGLSGSFGIINLLMGFILVFWWATIIIGAYRRRKETN